MKLKILILSFLAVFLVAGSASAVLIDDNYYGADDHTLGDVIGNVDNFGIDWMDVEISANTLSVEIRTNYSGNAGDGFDNLVTDFGDLFISTNGWNPYGTQPYLSDDHLTGENWEFAFDVSTASLYAITDSNIVLSEDAMPSNGWIYRNGQEVFVNPNGLTVLSTGTVGSYDAGFYSFDIDISGLSWSLDDLGFHWTMTCGNDVIEGATPVPEPATMLLLGTGLVCFAGFGRKRFFKRG